MRTSSDQLRAARLQALAAVGAALIIAAGALGAAWITKHSNGPSAAPVRVVVEVYRFDEDRAPTRLVRSPCSGD